MTPADVFFLQRSAGNRATTQAVQTARSGGLVVQRKIETDGTWAWIGGRGWATGAQAVWNYIQPRFLALQALSTELTRLRDGGAYEATDIDERVGAFTTITRAYDRKITLDEGKGLRIQLDALDLPGDTSLWAGTVKAELAERKRVADEARDAEERRKEDERRKAEELRLAEERRIAAELRVAQELEASRLAEEQRKLDEARQAQEAKEKKEADDKKKREDRAQKRIEQGPGPTDEQVGLWARQAQGGAIRTELSALMMSVNAKPVDSLLSTARESALVVETVVNTTMLDAGTMDMLVLKDLASRVSAAQKDFHAAWTEWGPSVELLKAVADETLQDTVRSHLKGLAKDKRAEHAAFLQTHLAHIDVAFSTLERLHKTAPDTALTVAGSEMTRLAKFNFDEDLRAEMETSVTHEVEKDISTESARLTGERDQFLKANPTKTRKDAGSAEARDEIVRKRKEKETTTASALEGMQKNKTARIDASLSAVTDLLAAANYSDNAVAVARWGVGSLGKDPAKLRKMLETYVRVAAAVSADRFILLAEPPANLDDVNWALTLAANDFEAARTYMTLVATVDKANLAKLAKHVTDRNGLARLVHVTLKGLTGAQMVTAVSTLRKHLDEPASLAVLDRLFGRAAGLGPAQISAFLEGLDADHVKVLSTLCATKGFDLAALKAIVDKDKGKGSDVLWILRVTRLKLTLVDVDELLDAKGFKKEQGEDVFNILESPTAGATVAITKDLLDFREPAKIYSYIDLTKGSHKAQFVLDKLNADKDQTFWTKETCGEPAHSGPAASVDDIPTTAVNPPVNGRYAGGNTFGNYGGKDSAGVMTMLLPGGPGHNEPGYAEYDLRLHDGTNRGARRMVRGGGKKFYTGDHYKNFAQFP